MLQSLFRRGVAAGSSIHWHRTVHPSVVRAVGVLTLVSAFSMMSWNERRLTLPHFAPKAVHVEANAPLPIDEIQYSAATGLLTSAIDIGDEPYLPPGPFLAIQRQVEMFSWIETFTPGSGLATYAKQWTEFPPDSNLFQQPAGHVNPRKPLASKLNRVPAAYIGVYNVDVGALILPPFRRLQLTDKTIIANGARIVENMLFKTTGSGEPEIGDIRIRYGVVPQGITATLYGGIQERNIKPFPHPNGFVSYHLFYGERADAERVIHAKADPFVWPLRAAGAVLIWLALCLLAPLGPIAQRWELIGSLHRPLRSVLLLPVALIVTVVLVLLLDIVFTMWVGIAAAAALILALILAERWIIRTIPVPAGPVDPRVPLLAAATLDALPTARLTLQNVPSTTPAQELPSAPITAAPPPPTLQGAPLSNLPPPRLETDTPPESVEEEESTEPSPKPRKKKGTKKKPAAKKPVKKKR